jgi:hypothetical protein
MATPADPADRHLLIELHRAFNAHDTDAVLARRASDVDWPSGMAEEVHQIARDRAGAVRSDRLVRHVPVIEGGLIRRMDIA